MLTNEDSLRLNVLLAQDLKAIRIDESRLTVFALTARGEASVPLNPNTQTERYLREVRELLSTHVLGSPGAYPVYIRRWTRMGQARDTNSLARLLLLGEPEAVTAVVHAPELTSEIAEYAWWAYPSAENARQLLKCYGSISTELGQTLAEFLLEFLPFEEEQQAIIDSVRLVLQPGLISEDQRLELWKRGKRRSSYYIGFLHTQADNLPQTLPAHAQWQALQQQLEPLVQNQNPYASQLTSMLSGSGQTFLQTVELALKKLSNQDATVELMNAIGQHLASIRPGEARYRKLEEVEAFMATLDAYAAQTPALQACLAKSEEASAFLPALLRLSLVSEYLVAPILGRTDAIGSVMRRRLEPVSKDILEQIAVLRGEIRPTS